MDCLIYLIGALVAALLTLYLLLSVLYLILKTKADPAVSLDTMPALKPVPIPTKKQKTPLHKLLAFIFEVRKWELVENWHYNLNDKVELVIPKGFRFDGASIPRPFWALLSPVGLLLIPGLLHDYGYKYDQIWQVNNEGCPVEYKKGAGKDFWDQLFKDEANEVNGMLTINAIAWLAVALGGNSTWKGHRQTNSKPDTPVLTTCKENPKEV